MHELSVTQHLLSIVLEHAEKASAKRILRVNLQIGALSGIIDESVQFYFDFIGRDTLAEGAKLCFTHVPARFRCAQCGQEFEPGERDWDCPECGATGGRLIAGQEMTIESIEVE